MILAALILGIVVAALIIGLWPWWNSSAKPALHQALSFRPVRIGVTIAAAFAIWASLFTWFGWRLGGDVAFQSSDGQWADSEEQFKGRDFASIALSFEMYKLSCNAEHAALQRTTSVPPPYSIRFWFNNYWEPKWRVPYEEPYSQTASGYYPPVTERHCANTFEFKNARMARERAQAFLRSLR